MILPIREDTVTTHKKGSTDDRKAMLPRLRTPRLAWFSLLAVPMILDNDKVQARTVTLETVVPTTEFSKPFLTGMLARMAMSFFKYGKVADAYPTKVSALESLRLRLDKYAETGNTEYLMDAANFAMIEFMHPSRPDAHYTPTDSDGSPGRIGNSGGRSQADNRSRVWGV